MRRRRAGNPNHKAGISERQPGETRGRKAIIEVRLQRRHTINGVPYGPGATRVREDIAAVLIEQERNYLAELEDRFTPHSGLIKPGGKLIEVPEHYFDQAWGSDQPITVVSGNQR